MHVLHFRVVRQRKEERKAILHFLHGKMKCLFRAAEKLSVYPHTARARGSRDHWSLAAFLSHLSFRWWKERWPPEAEQAIGIAGRRKRRPLQRPPCELRGRAAFPHMSPQRPPRGVVFSLAADGQCPSRKAAQGAGCPGPSPRNFSPPHPTFRPDIVHFDRNAKNALTVS